MKAIVKTAIVATSAALIASVSASSWAQQQLPGSTPPSQPVPAQPGPGMGQQQMQRGMEHEKAGQGMGGQMQQGREHAPMGPGMMQQQQQQPGTAQQPSQGTPPATSK